MPRVPQSKNNATPLQQFTDTAYDNVVICAENIDSIIAAAEATDVMVLYLGAHPTNPTEGKDGAPLVSGNFYLNTTSSSLVYYDAENDTWVESDVDTVVTAARDAEAARDAAQASQAAASTSASNASASAGQAASSASAAALSESNAATSESNTSVSEGNAANSANNAANSATEASGHADAAALSEGNAANSETAAAASESNAAASAVTAANAASQAEAAFDNFDDMYLGRKTTPPTTDNDGQPLQVGASYWHDNGDSTGEQRFWNGASWESPELTATQAAQQAVAARDDAEVAEGNALLYKNAAQASANAAGVDANNAGNSATAAATSETNAKASEDAAKDSEQAAKASETNSGTNATNAANSAAAAAVSEANAAASASIFEWQRYVRDEADLDTLREQHKSVRAASGFDDYGRHYKTASTATPINEGLWSYVATDDITTNMLVTGANGLGETFGESKTINPAVHVAGILFDYVNVNNYIATSKGQSWIKFPEAPNGTVIYDSSGDVRGTGKVSLDLTVDVDPKYGDVASDFNEAVARAFEGQYIADTVGRGNVNTTVIDSGRNHVKWSTTGTSAAGVLPLFRVTNGVSYKLCFNVACDYTTNQISILAGSGFNGGNIVRKSIAVPAGLDKSTYVEVDMGVYTGGNSGSYQFEIWYDFVGTRSVNNIRLVPVTEEVVIDRHDVFGGEFFLEEVSVANPYVYPKGMIQSKATEMNGITTVATNRPATYYAVFTGDTSSNGLGVDFWAASIQEKIDMVSDATNNLFLLKDGRLVQWRMRQCTAAGLGNGDWFSINCASGLDNSLCYQNTLGALTMPQGARDTVGTPNYTRNYRNIARNALTRPEVGVWSTHEETPDDYYGVGNECYFFVWGVVRRLNQGAYHPSFNPLGARTFADDNTSSGRITNSVRWYGLANLKPTSTVDCLRVYNWNSEYAGPGAWADSGYIGAPQNSGHSDNRFYDAIYEGGDGGVDDYRLPSWDMSSKKEASKVFQKVINGTYRGAERLPLTGKPMPVIAVTNRGSYLQVAIGGDDKYLESITNWCGRSDRVSAIENTINLRTGDALTRYGDVFQGNGSEANRIYMNCSLSTDIVQGDEVFCPSIYELSDSTVSGEFHMIDVIGAPARILDTPYLANGWQGGWSPQMPDASNRQPLTRKSMSTPFTVGTTDLGASWTTSLGGYGYNSTTNTLDPVGDTWVIIVNYTAFAKQTVEANNETVLNGYEGLGNVRTLAHRYTTQGALLSESFMGKIITNSNSGNLRGNYTLEEVLIHETSLSLDVGDTYAPKHAPLSLTEPNNDSPAVKALWYQTAQNQQVSLNFAWNELVWSPLINIQDINAGSSFNAEAGDTRRLNGFFNPSINGQIVRFSASVSGTWHDYSFNTYNIVDGEFHDIQLGTYDECMRVAKSGHQWGDNSKISVTAGTGTYTNLNGKKCLRGSATLSKPIGYTKNQARVGTQTEGVDF